MLHAAGLHELLVERILRPFFRRNEFAQAGHLPRRAARGADRILVDQGGIVPRHGQGILLADLIAAVEDDDGHSPVSAAPQGQRCQFRIGALAQVIQEGLPGARL